MMEFILQLIFIKIVIKNVIMKIKMKMKMTKDNDNDNDNEE